VRQGDHYVFLAEMLQAFADTMFPGFKVAGAYQFRVTRNSELIVEEEVDNLARALDRRIARPRLRTSGAVGNRQRLSAIDRIDADRSNFQLEETDVYRCDGPVNIIRVGTVYDDIDRPDLKFPRFTPAMPAHQWRQENLRCAGTTRHSAAPSLRIV
jgi:polyphosphate kinase